MIQQDGCACIAAVRVAPVRQTTERGCLRLDRLRRRRRHTGRTSGGISCEDRASGVIIGYNPNARTTSRVFSDVQATTVRNILQVEARSIDNPRTGFAVPCAS